MSGQRIIRAVISCLDLVGVSLGSGGTVLDRYHLHDAFTWRYKVYIQYNVNVERLRFGHRWCDNLAILSSGGGETRTKINGKESRRTKESRSLSAVLQLRRFSGHCRQTHGYGHFSSDIWASPNLLPFRLGTSKADLPSQSSV